jgi:hypothetical protein
MKLGKEYDATWNHLNAVHHKSLPSIIPAPKAKPNVA